MESVKNFLLLGSTKGIGYGIAEVLVRKNHNVFLGSRNQKNIQNAMEMLRRISSNSIIESMLVDVNDYISLETWWNRGVSIFKEIHGLLINYGGPPVGSFMDFHDQDWQNAFEFMLLNPIRLLRLAYPYLSQNRASVVFITSYAVKEPVDNLILSNVFRSGITALMKTLSREWGPEVRLNCIMPGRIDTERIRQLDQKIAKSQNRSEEEIKEIFESHIPMRRYGTIAEIGRLGAFLLTEESSYITGCSFAIDGGILRSLV